MALVPQEDQSENKLFASVLLFGGLNLRGKTISTPNLFDGVLRNLESLIISQQKLMELQILLESKQQKKTKSHDIMDDAEVLLDPTIRKIKQFLNSQEVDADIKISKFTDYEFPDWQKIQVTIQVKKNLSYIYHKIRPVVFRLVKDTLPKELLDKVLVKFENYR